MPLALNYANIFPTVVGDIFCRAIQDTCVRHSLLSIAAILADYRLHRPLDRFQVQYIASLQLIQSAIEKMSVDEELAIAVFLISWIDTVRGKFETARKHLNGLRLILQHIQPDCFAPASRITDSSGSTRVSPLIMQVWRFAIRLDFSASFYTVQPPVFPPIPAAEELHRRWILMAASSHQTAEWALAAFGVDNLIHRACHFAAQIREMRRASNSPEVEHQILPIVSLLQAEIQAWRRRPIIERAELIEQSAQNYVDERNLSSHSSQPFLHYPPLKIVNTFYCNLLNAWRALSIYVSFILDPNIGSATNPHRFDTAVEICRTLAALGEDKSNTASSKIWTLFPTGAAFGGQSRSPREAEFISMKMNEIAMMFPIMKEKIGVYDKLFGTQGDFWEELENTRGVLRTD
jgi:Fungal specific transcription factor domain